MVKSIRSAKDKGEAECIAKCLSEIKDELKSNVPELKAQAIKKLIYVRPSRTFSFHSFITGAPRRC